ncbi:helix-turn-helix domain-containing protein [Gaopeijia maritima]|uniref:helix-turn-helix domain-containing protein n=1 Tax=Gaopeijia maritima TaxID=3119007 RepID=UPI003283BA68
MRNDAHELMTVDEVADLFRVSPSTIRRWIGKGLPHLKVNQTLRFQREDVIDWAEGRAA